MICKKLYLYEGREDVTLTTYIQEDSPELMNGRGRGAVLVCPGGGYFYCSDREGEPVALAFAAQGYHAFVLRYSVYSHNRGRNTMENIIPDLSAPWTAGEGNAHPGPMRDIGKAMLFIKEHAEEWHIDPDKIAICGFSAGGHNCAMYSVYYNKPVITEYLGIEPAGIKPAASIIAYPLSDFFEVMKYPDHPTAEMWGGFIRSFIGENQTDDEFLRKLSPCMLVDEDTPPMFLWTTAADQLVDPMHTLKLAYALEEKNIPYELHIFEEGRHGLSLATQESASGKDQIQPDVAVWIQLADTWLKKRLAAEFPDEIEGF